MQVDQDIKDSNILFKPDMNKFYAEQDKLEKINTTHLNTTSVLNRSSMMTYSKIVCCICSATIDANAKGMCETCTRTEINITEGITKSGGLQYCKGCDRYLRPPWVRCGSSLESPEMMQMCLNKIRGLAKVKLVDTSFVWTEPHSKIIKLKLTVQKEMNKTLVETSFIVEFKVEWTQCDDCKKTFTPHIWSASSQIRQKVAHKRTFLYLEQLILKHKAHTRALNVKEHPEGVDFYFANKSQAMALGDFIKNVLPARVKVSKQLISHDMNCNTFNYKYTYMIELATISKDDLIVLDKETSKDLGGIGPVLLCHKLCSMVHLIDPLTFNTYEFNSSTYWRHEFKSYVNRDVLEEFLIINVEEEVDYHKKYANMTVNSIPDVEMSEEKDSKVNQSKSTNYKNVNEGKSKTPNRNHTYYNNNHNQFKVVTVQCIRNKEGANDCSLITTRSHLGNKIRPGDIFLGYNMTSLNINDELDHIMNFSEGFPDVILVKKKYVRSNNAKRTWKLKRIEKDVDMQTRKDKNGQTADDHYEEFLRDIEEDKDMRKNVNLYKDDEAIKELEGKFNKLKVAEKDDSDLDIKVDELLEDLNINDKEEEGKKDEEDYADNDDTEEVVDTFLKPNDKPNDKSDKNKTGAGNKKQIGKRERTGKKIDEN